MAGESRAVDLPRGALLRLLDRLDALPAEGAHTLYIPPAAAAAGLDEHSTAALERLPEGNGWVLFWGPAARVAVAPPFPVDERRRSGGYQTGPLRDLLNRPRTLGVVLIRLGGYSAGVYRDGAFVDTKTGGRFVKNRHRKGGQSQRRFERIREGQIREHFDDVAEVVRTKLLPVAADLDFVVLGGDRRTVQSWLKQAPLPPALAAKLLPRVLDVPEPRREVLERTPSAIWTSRAVIDAVPDDRA
jgi:peptide subunit release factor 1 (eRF1)